MALGEVDSDSNRNEYQEYLLGVKAAGAYGWQPYHLHVSIVLTHCGGVTQICVFYVTTVQYGW